jgi:hypothetical protein
MLNAAVDHYAYSLELYNAWVAQRATSADAVQAALMFTDKDNKLKDKPETEKLEYLRLQIEMRVLGLGWTQYATRWSSQADDKIGTVAHLKVRILNPNPDLNPGLDLDPDPDPKRVTQIFPISDSAGRDHPGREVHQPQEGQADSTYFYRGRAAPLRST